jgi:hypothetical protein
VQKITCKVGPCLADVGHGQRNPQRLLLLIADVEVSDLGNGASVARIVAACEHDVLPHLAAFVVEGHVDEGWIKRYNK